MSRSKRSEHGADEVSGKRHGVCLCHDSHALDAMALRFYFKNACESSFHHIYSSERQMHLPWSMKH